MERGSGFSDDLIAGLRRDLQKEVIEGKVKWAKKKAKRGHASILYSDILTDTRVCVCAGKKVRVYSNGSVRVVCHGTGKLLFRFSAEEVDQWPPISRV